MEITETMVRRLFSEVISVELPDPFPRMTYAEAMRRFGTDRPDLRIPLELVDLGDVMQDVEFKVFSGPAKDPQGRVAALRVPGGGEISRKDIDEYTQYVGKYGARGLAYIKVNDVAAGRDGLQSPILKFLPDDVVTAIIERTGIEDGDLVFFGADRERVVNESLGALRVKLGVDRNMLAGRLGAGVGGGFPDVRAGPEDRALDGAASPVHGTLCRRSEAAGLQPGHGAVTRL